MTLVSFVIATLNEEGDIEGLLESIKRQTHRKCEIIIVDGGSKDRTISIAKKYTRNVFVLRGIGVTKSKMYGVKRTQGSIVHLADADNRFTDRKYVEKMISLFEKYRPDAVAVRIRPSPSRKLIVRAQATHRALIWENRQKDVVRNVDPKNITFSCFRAPFLKMLMDKKYASLHGNDDLYLADKTKDVKGRTIFDPALSQDHKDPDTFGQIRRQARWYGRVMNQKYVPDKTWKLAHMIAFLLLWPSFLLALLWRTEPLLILSAVQITFFGSALYLWIKSKDLLGSLYLIYVLNVYRSWHFFVGYLFGKK